MLGAFDRAPLFRAIRKNREGFLVAFFFVGLTLSWEARPKESPSKMMAIEARFLCDSDITASCNTSVSVG